MTHKCPDCGDDGCRCQDEETLMPLGELKTPLGVMKGNLRKVVESRIKEIKEGAFPTQFDGENDRLGEQCLALATFLCNDVIAPKNSVYLGSWSKRGEAGVFHNLARKFDRIENIMLDPKLYEESQRGAENLYLTLADLISYGMMWLVWANHHNPTAFGKALEELERENKRFVERIAKSAQDK